MKQYRRMIGVYCLITLLFSVTILRVYALTTTDSLVATAGAQSTYSMDIAETRGVIYDRNMEKLVNRDSKYLASVIPTVQAANALLPATDEDMRDSLLTRLQGATPFVLGVSGDDIYAKGVDVFKVPERYGQDQLATHIVGYLGGGDNHGVSGIEKAYDQYLTETGTEIKMRYSTDAAGRVMTGGGYGVERTGSGEAVGGVVLTLDARIQRLVENALAGGCDKGAAVVLDTMTGDILASASLPTYDPSHVAASFESTDAPFINRATSGYNIGSAFKVIVSTAALESGISTGYSHTCEGYIEVNGITFRCNNHAIHGEIAMDRALQVSCNTYFISLAQQIDPSFLLSIAENLGLASALELAPGMTTQKGNLPSATELSNEAAYANFSFGQGSSLASPLQMATAVAQIANTGLSITPRLVKGFTLDGETLVEEVPLYSHNQVIRQDTAATMRKLMVSVVEEGSGRTAKPLQGSAGGKTSSAQTGQYVDDEEIVHAWFVGFFPAAQPKYAVAVFVEGGESGERVAAPIFRQIADGIGGLA